VARIVEWAGPRRNGNRRFSAFIQLIFPKYVAVLENIQIEDHYSIPAEQRKRFIDIALVDANGNLDVIEIKRPFDDVLLSKTQYRDNSCQLEIYPARLCRPRSTCSIYRSGASPGEAKLTKKYRELLPSGCQSGSLIPRHFSFWAATEKPDGSTVLDQHEAFDLEVIKRKYVNMMTSSPTMTCCADLTTSSSSLSRRAVAS